MSSTTSATEPQTTASRTAVVCPYLLAADGAWRASTPSRDHRCTAVVPATLLAPDKQRRLCLVARHEECSTYRVARAGGHLADLDPDRPTPVARRPVRELARTTPLVLDHGRVAISMPALRLDRGTSLGQAAQVGLVALMAVALLAIVIGRPEFGGPDGSGSGAVAGVPTASPTTDTAQAGTTPLPERTLVPTEVEPTAPPDDGEATEPTAEPTAAPTEGQAEATPAPTERPTTYKVKKGDTLSGIASVFGTTWQELAKLNGIDDPGRLKVGQELKLP